jgi:acyl-CoA synthetase (NDP forming)
VQIAQRGGVRIIGPNCLGIYCPSSSLSFSVDLPQQSGPLGLLCQSGGNTAYLIRAFTTRGVYLSKAVSYGNAADINETELLDYFIHDSETKIISAYIEGAKNGKQFFKVLKEAARSKPVIILKGGKTESGAATAASHTGALASSASTWDALIEQANAIQVDSLEEMVDMACLFAYMPPPRGKRMGVVGLGGGASVLSADSCAKAGLSLPTLPEEIRQKLRNLTTGAGNIFRNPVDTQSLFIGEKQFAETVKIVGGWEQIDILLLHIAYDEMAGSIQLVRDLGMFRFMLQTGINAAKETGKPVAVALHYTALSETFKSMCEGREICWKAGLPVFYSMSGAANAISKFLRYHESKAQIG